MGRRTAVIAPVVLLLAAACGSATAPGSGSWTQPDPFVEAVWPDAPGPLGDLADADAMAADADVPPPDDDGTIADAVDAIDSPDLPGDATADASPDDDAGSNPPGDAADDAPPADADASAPSLVPFATLPLCGLGALSLQLGDLDCSWSGNAGFCLAQANDPADPTKDTLVACCADSLDGSSPVAGTHLFSGLTEQAFRAEYGAVQTIYRTPVTMASGRYAPFFLRPDGSSVTSVNVMAFQADAGTCGFRMVSSPPLELDFSRSFAPAAGGGGDRLFAVQWDPMQAALEVGSLDVPVPATPGTSPWARDTVALSACPARSLIVDSFPCESGGESAWTAVVGECKDGDGVLLGISIVRTADGRTWQQATPPASLMSQLGRVAACFTRGNDLYIAKGTFDAAAPGWAVDLVDVKDDATAWDVLAWTRRVAVVDAPETTNVEFVRFHSDGANLWIQIRASGADRTIVEHLGRSSDGGLTWRFRPEKLNALLGGMAILPDSSCLYVREAGAEIIYDPPKIDAEFVLLADPAGEPQVVGGVKGVAVPTQGRRLRVDGDRVEYLHLGWAAGRAPSDLVLETFRLDR